MFATEHKSKSKTHSEAKSASKNRTSDDIKPIPIKSLFSPLAAQLKPAMDNNELTPIPKTNEAQENLRTKVNNTGIPTLMKNRFETLSGLSFDDVRVHYNSDKPAQLQALAYTQGNQVYVAPGQEKHLGHELGHVVQQKQGIVKATMQLQSFYANDNETLEQEADLIDKEKISHSKNNNLKPMKLNIVQMCGRIVFESKEKLGDYYFTLQVNLNEVFQKFLSDEDDLFPSKGHTHQPYSTGGKQKATTTIGWGWEGEDEDYEEPFSTTGQMHSEMMAIDFGLKEGFLEIQDGKVVYGVGDLIASDDMDTDIPHCRFCTFILGLLGIERKAPTTTNFLYAEHLNYPLPDAIKYNLEIINKTANLFGFTDINNALLQILPTRSRNKLLLFSPEFQDVIVAKKDYDKVLINQFWKGVFYHIYHFSPTKFVI